MTERSAERTVFDFGDGAPGWPSLDDRVMGGRSSSRMRVDGRVAAFEGTVTREGGGGFASVRSAESEHDLYRCEGLALRVRGDGRRYGLRLRTERGLDGVNYQSGFDTRDGVWIDVRLPFDSFVPLYRGRRVTGHPPLDPASIRSFGFITSAPPDGDFRLQIETIRAYGPS